jgi:hypothetical protein
MAKPFQQWTVLPHGKLTRVEDDILTVTGELEMPPMGKVQRRMTVVRIGDGRLVVYSAISLDENEMRALMEFGTPAFLIVPSDIHRMDVKAWKDRFPTMRVIAPASARKKVEDETDAGTTLVLNDLIFDLANRPGLRGWLFKLIGMTGDAPHIPPPVKMRQVKDDGALGAQLASWSRLPRLRRVIISHGAIITDEPEKVLRRIAHDLAA